MIGDHPITGGVCGDGNGVSGIRAFRRPWHTAEPVGQEFSAINRPRDGAQATSCLIGRVGAGKLDGQRSNGKCWVIMHTLKKILRNGFFWFSAVFWLLAGYFVFELKHRQNQTFSASIESAIQHILGDASALQVYKSCELDSSILYLAYPNRVTNIEKQIYNFGGTETCHVETNDMSGILTVFQLSSKSLEERLNQISKIRLDYEDSLNVSYIPGFRLHSKIIREPFFHIKYGASFPNVKKYGENSALLFFEIDTHRFALMQVVYKEIFHPSVDIMLISKNRPIYIDYILAIFLTFFPTYMIATLIIFKRQAGISKLISSMLVDYYFISIASLIILTAVYATLLYFMATPLSFFQFIFLYISCVIVIFASFIFRPTIKPANIAAVFIPKKIGWTTKTMIEKAIEIAKSKHMKTLVPVQFFCEKCSYKIPVFRIWSGIELSKDNINNIVQELRKNISFSCPRCGHLSEHAGVSRDKEKKTMASELRDLTVVIWLVPLAVAIAVIIFYSAWIADNVPYVGWIISMVAEKIGGYVMGFVVIAILAFAFTALALMSRAMFSKRRSRGIWACEGHGILMDNSDNIIPDEIISCPLNDIENKKCRLRSASEFRF